MTRSASGRRRFYSEASVASGEDGSVLLLDGRGVRTPRGRPLALPSPALAEAIALEWRAQRETIEPATMPLTRLANVALDRIPAGRAQVVDHLLAYAGTDLVCYRALGPLDLVARQEAAWQPLLDWVAATHGARLAVTFGIVPVAQPGEALAALEAVVALLDDWSLGPLVSAVEAAGSLVIGLALLAGRLDGHAAFAASQLDETYQIERWGEDAEAAARRRELLATLQAAASFHILAKGGR